MQPFKALFPHLQSSPLDRSFVLSDPPLLKEPAFSEASSAPAGLEAWFALLDDSDPEGTHLRQTLRRLTGLSVGYARTSEAKAYLLLSNHPSQAPTDASPLQSHLSQPHHTGKDDAAAFAVESPDHRSLLFELPQGRDFAACVVDIEGTGLFFQSDGASLQITPVARGHRLLPQPPPPLEDTEIRTLASALQASDPDLASWVQEALAIGGDWQIALAAGRLAFLKKPTRGLDAKALVESLLRGQPPPPAPSVLWARGWSKPQVQRLESLVSLHISQIREELEALDESFQHRDLEDSNNSEVSSPAVEAIREVLGQREDLACILPLLKLHGPLSPSITDALHLLDREGLASVRFWPALPALYKDAFLGRVLEKQRDAWWAYPAAPTVLLDNGLLFHKDDASLEPLSSSPTPTPKIPLREFLANPSAPSTTRPSVAPVPSASAPQEASAPSGGPSTLAPLASRLTPASSKPSYLELLSAPLRELFRLVIDRLSSPLPSILYAGSGSNKYAPNKLQGFDLEVTDVPGVFVLHLDQNPRAQNRSVSIFFQDYCLAKRVEEGSYLLDLTTFFPDQASSVDLKALSRSIRLEFFP